MLLSFDVGGMASKRAVTLEYSGPVYPFAGLIDSELELARDSGPEAEMVANRHAIAVALIN